MIRGHATEPRASHLPEPHALPSPPTRPQGETYEKLTIPQIPCFLSPTSLSLRPPLFRDRVCSLPPPPFPPPPPRKRIIVV
ncbi:hypothetical protein E2C01_096762 [Portunus trituberculatus]|uniref:Uncharacterized protein n=1 Tax=Portunus trituberculatus TaxID=210409 RepID=A0A5B7JYR1_PORTR|nr:hypothetical protein [Portunus trituberculatus]